MHLLKATPRRLWPKYIVNMSLFFGSISSTSYAPTLREDCPLQIMLPHKIWLKGTVKWEYKLIYTFYAWDDTHSSLCKYYSIFRLFCDSAVAPVTSRGVKKSHGVALSSIWVFDDLYFTGKVFLLFYFSSTTSKWWIYNFTLHIILIKAPK